MEFKGLQITSLKNPKVKKAMDLYKKRQRDATGLFLIEGYRELLRACQGSAEIEQLFFCPELFLGENEYGLIDQVKGFTGQIYRCEKHVFQKLSYRDRPDGLIAVARQTSLRLKDLKKILQQKTEKMAKPFLAVAESIEKPGNLGTILRSLDGAGADALILCDERTDLYNPNVVRASVGTLFSLPVIQASSSETLQFLKAENIKIVASTPRAEKFYSQENFSEALAIALGSEQLGLSEEWLEKADIKVKIPMLGISDSLNVASAAVLLFYEAVKQRESFADG